MAVHPEIDDRPYLTGYLFWLAAGTLFWVVCWHFGQQFTLRISAQIHGDVLKRILKAPIDRFFDKHPVGRIMNRMSADLVVVDLYLYMKATGTIAIVYQTLIPLIYVHTILPMIVTFLAVPFYYLIWTLCISRSAAAVIPQCWASNCLLPVLADCALEVVSSTVPTVELLRPGFPEDTGTPPFHCGTACPLRVRMSTA